MTAIRAGGGNTDPEVNTFLRTAIDRAREANMPRDNIDRLLSSFEAKKASLVKYFLEGYGPHGVPIVAEVETDSKNRTLSEVRTVFKTHGGGLGEEGCVMYQFDKKYEIEVNEKVLDNQQLDLIDAGADEIDGNKIMTAAENVSNLLKKIGEAGLKVIKQERTLIARVPLMLEKEEEVVDVLDLTEELENDDDVIGVYAGFDFKEKTSV